MEEKNKKNQRERVLDYLNKGGILTDYNGVQIGVGGSPFKSKRVNQRGLSNQERLEKDTKSIRHFNRKNLLHRGRLNGRQ